MKSEKLPDTLCMTGRLPTLFSLREIIILCSLRVTVKHIERAKAHYDEFLILSSLL